MKKGDIILFKAKGFYGKIINWLTKGPYYHSELMITNNLSLKIYARGATVRYISSRYYDFDVYRPKYKDMDQAINRAHEILNDMPTFGFINFMAFLFIKALRKFKIKWFESDKFLTCSEGCADCLEDGGVDKYSDIPNSILSPNDLPREYNMKKI